jgi:hypothetical protein
MQNRLIIVTHRTLFNHTQFITDQVDVVSVKKIYAVIDKVRGERREDCTFWWQDVEVYIDVPHCTASTGVVRVKRDGRLLSEYIDQLDT